MNPELTLSIVSHGQRGLVQALLGDLTKCGCTAQVIVTHNLADASFGDADFQNLNIVQIHNPKPLGFGANHNQAFQQCQTAYFAVLNPDLRIARDPFPALLAAAKHRDFGALGPLVKNRAGEIEDSARRFPTMARLIAKALGLSTGRQDHSLSQPAPVDWVAGMFMLFESKTFARIGGFDERYFLYYEDADLCTRLWRQGLPVMIVPEAEVIHDAQRQSHRSLRYLKWHLASMARYLWRYAGRLPRG